MDYSTLKSRVEMYLDRDDVNTTANPYCGYWINDHRLELATQPGIQWPHLWTESYVTTSAGSSDYALPSNYLDHLMVRIGAKDLHPYLEADWNRVVMNDQDDPPDTDEPDGFYMKGETLRLRPPPDGAYTMYMVYYARPTDFSVDTDADFWSNNYPYVLIHGAVILGATFLDDEKKFKIHTSLYDRALMNCLKKEKSKKYRNAVVQVRTYKDFGAVRWNRMLTPHDT
jgi:hypothetical protein